MLQGKGEDGEDEDIVEKNEHIEKVPDGGDQSL